MKLALALAMVRVAAAGCASSKTKPLSGCPAADCAARPHVL
jgi:hypothetical protein